MYYRELLKLCQWTDEEIEKEKPRIEGAFERARITAEDCKEGERRISKFYDMRTTRKAMGMWLRKFINIALCKDEYRKAVYHVHLGYPRYCLALGYAAPDVFSDFVDGIPMFVMGPGCFNRIDEIYKSAEENGLGAGLAHCGVNQVALGAITTGMFPVPDIVVGGRQQCDQSAKLLELMGERLNIPYACFDTERDEPFGSYPEYFDESAMKYWAGCLEDTCKKVEEVVGVTVTDDDWRKARITYAKMWHQLDEINNLNSDIEPRPYKFANFQPVWWGVLDPEVNVVAVELPKILEEFKNEIIERRDEGYAVLPKDAPRTFITCPPVCDPGVADMYEECGLNIVQDSSAMYIASWEMMPHKYSKWSEKVAESYMRKGYLRTCDGHIVRAKDITDRYRLDGVLYAYVWSCRAVTPPAYMIKETIEKELGLPAATLEVDAFDPRDHTPDSLRTRVEAFAEMLRSHKSTRLGSASQDS